MRQVTEELAVATHGPGLYDVTDKVRAFTRGANMATGLLTVFCRHTSASLVIQENADPDVQRDLMAFFRRLVPEGDSLYTHTLEGEDDMPAHVKSALTQSSLAIPVNAGKPVLGSWQGVYLFEHRHRPHQRHLVLHIVGE
jgi:secondary thiamine-phosphate synthase enzyme